MLLFATMLQHTLPEPWTLRGHMLAVGTWLSNQLAKATASVTQLYSLGKKREPKPKLFGPDILGWGGGLPREWVGAKKFGMSLKTREIQLFCRDIPGFCQDIPEVPEKFEKKCLCSIFVPYSYKSCDKCSAGILYLGATNC